MTAKNPTTHAWGRALRLEAITILVEIGLAISTGVTIGLMLGGVL